MRRPSLEHVVFGVSVITLTALVLWWSVFARKLSVVNYETSRAYIEMTIVDPHERDTGIRKLDEHFAAQARMIVGEGASFAVLLLICTITLFLVARQKHAATERMERVLQLTTHELKTPIAGVKALLQSLALGSIPEGDEQRFLDQGVTECNRLEHLTESILAYQRAVARAHTRLDVADPKTLINEVLDHRRGTHGQEAIEVHLAGDQPPVWVDRDAFRVIFENLLDNAKKYGGERPIALDGHTENGVWQLRVRDHGIGFKPEQREALFDPFVREVRHETARTHGSGLGLYISRQLAQRIGGTLRAHSDGPNQGAVFILALRVAV